MACGRRTGGFGALKREMFDVVRSRSLGNKDLAQCPQDSLYFRTGVRVPGKLGALQVGGPDSMPGSPQRLEAAIDLTALSA